MIILVKFNVGYIDGLFLEKGECELFTKSLPVIESYFSECSLIGREVGYSSGDHMYNDILFLNFKQFMSNHEIIALNDNEGQIVERFIGQSFGEPVWLQVWNSVIDATKYEASTFPKTCELYNNLISNK